MKTKKIVITLQVIAAVYLLANMIYSNLNGFDLLSTATGLLGMFGNILLAWKKSGTFALNMSNNVLGFVLSFKNRLYAEVGMNAWYFGTQLFQGIPYFRKNKDKNGEVITDKQSNWADLAGGIIIGFIAMGAFSVAMNGQMIFLDSFQNAVALMAQRRQMKGKADGWILWIISNVINAFVWGVLQNWIMVGSFLSYTIIAASGYLWWSREQEV